MKKPQEDIELICCDEGELEYLQEEIENLAEDVVNIDDTQDEMLDVIQGLCKNWMDMCAIMLEQKEKIKALSDELEETDKVWWWVAAMLIWLVILTLLFWYYVLF